ncbi:MAG TPA: shikimate kinase [Ohtaekwangia sp.]
MKIYLIGMPGSGKSTLGKEIAAELLLPFIDLDTEIERKELMSIPEVFREKGEDYFRQTESQVLSEWASAEKSFVMATGGGAPCFYNGIDVINNSGLSVFLDVPVDELLKRVKQDINRPLLNTSDLNERKQRLASLYENRLTIYNLAKIKLSNPTKKSVLEALHLKM